MRVCMECTVFLCIKQVLNRPNRQGIRVCCQNNNKCNATVCLDLNGIYCRPTRNIIHLLHVALPNQIIALGNTVLVIICRYMILFKSRAAPLLLARRFRDRVVNIESLDERSPYQAVRI